jgi:hypothetical protein
MSGPSHARNLNQFAAIRDLAGMQESFYNPVKQVLEQFPGDMAALYAGHA